MTKKILVCGGRNYEKIRKIWVKLNELVQFYGYPLIIIHGGCPNGTDKVVEKWATSFLSHSVKSIVYPADWATHGKAAGPIRNQQMIDENPDISLVLAFPGGKGTADMIRRAKAAGLKVEEVKDE